MDERGTTQRLIQAGRGERLARTSDRKDCNTRVRLTTQRDARYPTRQEDAAAEPDGCPTVAADGVAPPSTALTQAERRPARRQKNFTASSSSRTRQAWTDSPPRQQGGRTSQVARKVLQAAKQTGHHVRPSGQEVRGGRGGGPRLTRGRRGPWAGAAGGLEEGSGAWPNTGGETVLRALGLRLVSW